MTAYHRVVILLSVCYVYMIFRYSSQLTSVRSASRSGRALHQTSDQHGDSQLPQPQDEGPPSKVGFSHDSYYHIYCLNLSDRLTDRQTESFI